MPQKKSTKSTKGATDSPSQLIDARIAELDDWRGRTLTRVRTIIKKADKTVVEEWKWNVPVWSSGGIICTGEVYKKAVKLTFAKGASLADPSDLFNSSLDGKVRRAIDIHEGETIDAAALTNLVREAVALNGNGAKPKAKKTTAKKSRLLVGGNPQIAKGYGDAPVQAYIAAMPGWKREIGRRLDEIISRTVPNVYKAIKWNSPLYGIEGDGWFLGVHVYARYVKVTFLKGALLKPLPPGESKSKEVRHLNITEKEPLDEKQFAKWVKQASKLPGVKM